MSERKRFFSNLNSRVNEVMHELYAGHCPTTKRLATYANDKKICSECKEDMSEDTFYNDHILSW